MPKIPKPRRRKRERRMASFQTPPTSVPRELSTAQEFEDVRGSSLMKVSELSQPKTQVPSLTKAAGSSLSLLSPFSQEFTGVTASPPARPSLASISRASSSADGPSPLPPPSMVSSSYPDLSSMVLVSTAEPAPAASQPGACALPNSTMASLHSPNEVPSSPEVQPTRQRDTDQLVLMGPPRRAAAKRHMSLRELAAIRSMHLHLQSLSGQWVNRGQMLLSPLLSHLRSSSASGSLQRPQEPTQQQQTNGHVAVRSTATDERGRLPEKPHQRTSKLHWRDEWLDHHDSAPCAGQYIPSSSRTLGGLPADTIQSKRHFPALKTAVCSQKHGAFQTTVFYFVLLVAFVLPFHTLPLRIVNHDVDYWCARPSHLHNVSPEMWKEVMIPQSEDNHYSRCRMNAEWNTTGVATVPCLKWQYAQSPYGVSIVKDFNLVCERAWYLPLTCCAFDAGAIFTLIASGLVADHLGRKPVIQFSTVVLQASGAVIVFATIMNSFIAMRLLQGAASSTLFNTSFVLLIEVLSPEHRTLYSIAAMMGKVAATLDGRSLFEVRQQWARTRRDFDEGCLKSVAPDAHCEAQRARCRRHNSIILYYLWTVTTVASEAASLKIHYLDWYPAALLALSSLLAFPTELVAIVSAARLGRRASQGWALGLAGLACLVCGTLGDDSVVLSAALLLVASLSVDASQTVGTLYTAEMYPTVVRCTGLAMCKTFSAVASVTMPLAAYLGLFPVSSVPLGVVSIMCVTAAYLVMWLLDTMECATLPDQLAEAPLNVSPP
ncbi:hypothetical protein HPB51_003320 [Rhipicephalus microplus]|uniref:Uncharacterized protein n=1 Tax=Rhipicephalus microplus TaxID=6941 RepID=A0A9J6DF30_RHIMP|nr:hypothetical protein HPB51_003320 [Rhipicephalus microplus]